jgi:hypothetical protein
MIDDTDSSKFLSGDGIIPLSPNHGVSIKKINDQVGKLLDPEVENRQLVNTEETPTGTTETGVLKSWVSKQRGGLFDLVRQLVLRTLLTEEQANQIFQAASGKEEGSIPLPIVVEQKMRDVLDNIQGPNRDQIQNALRKYDQDRDLDLN